MELSKEQLDYIKRVVNVASITKVDSIVVETGRVRGIDSDQIIILLQVDDVPAFDVGAIGLNRIHTLHSRIQLADSSFGTYTTQISQDSTREGELFVRQIKFAAGKQKVEYRCANPLTIKAPKNLSFNDSLCVFDVSSDTLATMSKGAIAMGSDELVLSGKGCEISATIRDIGGDELSIVVGDGIAIDPNFTTFQYSYPLKNILPLLKVCSQPVRITTRGLLNLTIDGFNVYILPRT